MTPKEKASELVLDFQRLNDGYDAYWNITAQSKMCAEIACDNIIKEFPDCSKYWEEVKNEINNLPEYL